MNSVTCVRLLCEPADAIEARVAGLCRAAGWELERHGSAEELTDHLRRPRAGCLVLVPGRQDVRPALDLIGRLRSSWQSLPVVLAHGDGEPPELAAAAIHAGAFAACRAADGQSLSRLLHLAVAFDREGYGPPCAVRSRLASLSPREREVMELALQGHSTDAMAALLGVCYQTINKHRARIRLKMRVDCDVRMLQHLHGQPPTAEQCGYAPVPTPAPPAPSPTAPHYSPAAVAVQSAPNT